MDSDFPGLADFDAGIQATDIHARALNSVEDVVFDPQTFAGSASENEASKVQEGLHDETEIEKLTLDENLPMYERLKILVNSENRFQQMAAFSLLPLHIKSLNDGRSAGQALATFLCSLRPLLQSSMADPDEMIRGLMMKHVMDLIESARFYETRQVMISCALDLCTKNAIQSSYGPTTEENAQGLESMLFVIEQLIGNKDINFKEHDERASNFHSLCKGTLSNVRSSGTRAFGARLLGLMARVKYLDRLTDTQRSEIQVLTLALCQDVDTEVRQAMSVEIGCLATENPTWFENNAMNDFVELLQDEEVDVRCGAMTSLGPIAQAITQRSFKETILPLFMKHVETFVGYSQDEGWFDLNIKEAQLVRELVLSLGPAIYTFEADAKSEIQDPKSSLSKLVGAYRCYARARDPTTRRVCIYIFPGVLKTIGAGNFLKYLQEVFEALCTDEESIVRVCASKVIEPVVEILGKQRVSRHLIDLLKAMCKDSSLEVRNNILDSWLSIQDKFLVADLKQRTTILDSMFDITMSLLLPDPQCSVVKNNWRYRVKGLETLISLPKDIYDDKLLHQRSVPALINYMRYGGEPLRLAAARALSWFVINNSASQLDARLVHDIKCEFGKAPQWSMRSLFIYWCCELGRGLRGHLDFFEKHRLEEALGALGHDRVAGIRLALCKALPEFTQSGIMTRAFVEQTLIVLEEVDTSLAPEIAVVHEILQASGIQDAPEVVKRRNKDRVARTHGNGGITSTTGNHTNSPYNNHGVGNYSSVRKLPAIKSASNSKQQGTPSSHISSSYSGQQPARRYSSESSEGSHQQLSQSKYDQARQPAGASSVTNGGSSSYSSGTTASTTALPTRPLGSTSKPSSVRQARIKHS